VLVSADGHCTIKVRAVPARRERAILRIHHAYGDISGAALSPDGELLAMAETEGVYLWDVPGPK
jgi:hypothetical protein